MTGFEDRQKVLLRHCFVAEGARKSGAIGYCELRLLLVVMMVLSEYGCMHILEGFAARFSSLRRSSVGPVAPDE